jgi:hypothetical protein
VKTGTGQEISGRQIEALQILAGTKQGRIHLNTLNALRAKGLIEDVPTGETSNRGFPLVKNQLSEAGKLALGGQS